MKFKLLTLFFFFMFVVRPEPDQKTAVIVGTYLVLKAQKLIRLTLRARQNGALINYVLSPGQAIADATAQTFRCIAYAVEFLLIVLYSRLIAYMCQTPASRNIVAAYTVLIVLVHSWEHLLYGIYGEHIGHNNGD